MDPDATLAEIRELIEDIKVRDKADDAGDPMCLLDNAARLAELVENLDKWLSSGAYLPRDWREKGGTL